MADDVQTDTTQASLSLRSFLIAAAIGIVPVVAVSQFLPMGALADFDELPLHPLIVHGVIVALPAVAVWFVVAAWRPQVLVRTWWLGWALAVIAVLGTLAAASSGESLAAAVGNPAEHAEAGDRLGPVSLAMAVLVLALVYLRLVRRLGPTDRVVSVLGTIVAVALLPLTYVAGHTGAEAVWKEPYAEARQPIVEVPGTYTVAEVARHASPEDCWTIVNGTVYDVTSFISRHPAGAADIRAMCGRDASDDFLGQHEGQREPEDWLATLRIGAVRD